jgi:hypothetical protein
MGDHAAGQPAPAHSATSPCPSGPRLGSAQSSSPRRLHRCALGTAAQCLCLCLCLSSAAINFAPWPARRRACSGRRPARLAPTRQFPLPNSSESSTPSLSDPVRARARASLAGARLLAGSALAHLASRSPGAQRPRRSPRCCISQGGPRDAALRCLCYVHACVTLCMRARPHRRSAPADTTCHAHERRPLLDADAAFQFPKKGTTARAARPPNHRRHGSAKPACKLPHHAIAIALLRCPVCAATRHSIVRRSVPGRPAQWNAAETGVLLAVVVAKRL